MSDAADQDAGRADCDRINHTGHYMGPPSVAGRTLEVDLQDNIKALSKLPRSIQAPFLTLYLNTTWSSEKDRERVRLYVKNGRKELTAQSAYASESVEKDWALLEESVDSLINREWGEDNRGVAIFSCSEMGVNQTVSSRMPFRDSLHCADRPVLRQAAEQAHLGEPAILAQATSKSGRLIKFDLAGEKTILSFVDNEFPGRHDQGGWSQARFQRHIDEHIHRNLKRLAEELTGWIDSSGAKRVVLSGSEVILARFEEHLPKRIGDAVCARIHIEPTATDDVVRAMTLEALKKALEEKDRLSLDTVLDKGLAMGHAVAGASMTADCASNLGKIHCLYIDRDFNLDGWTCVECGAVGPGSDSACPTCSAPVVRAELGEELVRATLAGEGSIVTVTGHDGLRREGGVAATVRYT